MTSDACTAAPPPFTASADRTAPPWPGLAVLLLGGFVTIFDLFVVNVAIPSLKGELGASLAEIGFVVAGYELAFGVLLVTGGRLGDLHGRRRLFMAGMAGFTAASALCGLAPDAPVLIGARLLQGLAAALLFPQVYASIRVHFAGDDGRRAFGFLGMTLGLAAIAGQILGGLMIEADIAGLGWRLIFLVNVPIGLFALAAARLIPESRAPERPMLDWPGVGLVTSGLILLLVPLIEASTQGWPLWSVLSLAAGVVVLAVFYRHQEGRRRTGRQPLLDMALLRDPAFARGGLLVLLIYSTASSFFLCFALMVQVGFGFGPLAAGSAFVPCSIGFVAASLAAPGLVSRFGTRAISLGAALYAVSLGLLVGQVWLAGATLVVGHLIPTLILVGAAQGLIMTPLVNLVLGVVAERQAGMAAGVISTLQQVGAAFGVAVVGLLFAASLGHPPAAGGGAGAYAAAFVGGMLYNLAAAVLAGLLLMRMAPGPQR